MRTIPTTPVVLGTSSLGERPGGPELAAAIVASPFGGADTSNMYAHGESERLLGAALRESDGVLAGGTLYSKADADPSTGAFDGDRVRRSLDESLQRLGVDHLALYHLHDPYGITFEEAMGPGGAVPALLALREEGVIDAIGIASGTIAQVHRYVATEAFDAVLSHNRLTLVDRSAQPTFELARSLEMTVFNAAPFGGGTLANGASGYGYQQMPADFAAHVERLRALAEEHGVDLAAAALHFSLRHPLVDATVVGISSVQRLDALGGLLQTEVPSEFFDAVEALGPPPSSGID